MNLLSKRVEFMGMSALSFFVGHDSSATAGVLRRIGCGKRSRHIFAQYLVVE